MSIEQTKKHKAFVKKFMDNLILKLVNRAVEHDNSKLKEPEASIFEKYTPLLKNTTYGSDEYKKYLKEMEPALHHHYSNNRHHPEHFEQGVNDMNLVDLIEMTCDWYAATLRHSDGDINKSIEINKKRFGISDQLATILSNTVIHLFEK